MPTAPDAWEAANLPVLPVSYTHLDVYKRQSHSLEVTLNLTAILIFSRLI